MKQILLPLLFCAGFSAGAQTLHPPGDPIRSVDSVFWNGKMQHQGSTFRLNSGGTVIVNRLEERLAGTDTCIFAVSQSGRYYAMNPAAERHTGGKYAHEPISLARPGDEFGASLYDAGRSLRHYQGLKLGALGTGLAAVFTVTLAAEKASGTQQGRSNTGTYVVAGALAGASFVFSMLADGQVYRAGRLLQVASGKFNLGRSR